MLAHLVAFGIENKTGGNNILECHTVKHEGGYGMQCEEPSACLVYALIDEIGRESQLLINQFLILKRIMYLCIRHRTGIEPHVDKVALALHRLAGAAHQHNIVNVRTMDVNAVVVFL